MKKNGLGRIKEARQLHASQPLHKGAGAVPQHRKELQEEEEAEEQQESQTEHIGIPDGKGGGSGLQHQQHKYHPQCVDHNQRQHLWQCENRRTGENAKV